MIGIYGKSAGSGVGIISASRFLSGAHGSLSVLFTSGELFKWFGSLIWILTMLRAAVGKNCYGIRLLLQYTYREYTAKYGFACQFFFYALVIFRDLTVI